MEKQLEYSVYSVLFLGMQYLFKYIMLSKYTVSLCYLSIQFHYNVLKQYLFKYIMLFKYIVSLFF